MSLSARKPRAATVGRLLFAALLLAGPFVPDTSTPLGRLLAQWFEDLNNDRPLRDRVAD